MIVKEHIPTYERLAPYFKPAALMLGNQRNTAGYKFPCDYATLDPDGGDLKLDLSRSDTPRAFVAEYQTVFNLGTLEHIWDVHTAYVNAAGMVKVGGHFLGQTPIAGWEGHGIHITSGRFILEFFRLNGFSIMDHWMTSAAGTPYDLEPARNCGKSLLQCFVARRVSLTDDWKKPSQIYKDGVKP